MRFRITIPVVFLILSAAGLNGQDKPEGKGLRAINEDVIKAQMAFLASDWMEGRAAGEKGERMAGDYIAGMLQLYGVKPFGDFVRTRNNQDNRERTYFQNFILLKTVPGNDQVMQIRSIEGNTIKTTSLTLDVDFIIRPSDPSFELTAPVVFAGYAYKNDKLQYNDFARLDVKGKVILRISGFPKFVTDKFNHSELASESEKMDSVIRAMGAAGIIEFSYNDRVVGRPERPDFLNLSPSEGNIQAGRPRAYYSIPGEKFNDTPKRASVSVKTANEIVKGSGIDIKEYIAKADINQPYLIDDQNNKEIYIKTSVNTSQVSVRNIIGIIEGEKTDEVIVLGAHYDHIGSGKGYIWNGADDNASGTVGVMTLAKAIMETGSRPEKTIIIALWTSEEMGLLGSRYYLDNLDYPISNLKLNLNFDMISRYVTDSEPTKVTMTYTKKYKFFETITSANQKNYKIDLSIDYQPSDDPPGGSDHRSFVSKGVPVLRFKPGHREEYHKPGDEYSTLDWDIMEKIIRISFLDIWQLANSEW